MGLARKEILNKLRSLLRRKAEPEDPYAYVTTGLKRGPGGRSSAVALEEPQAERVLDLFGKREIR